ncbi:hypothetical protein OE88DRAFT_1639476, partial [Heliocybe sulcata]
FKLGPRQAHVRGVHITLDKQSDDQLTDIWVKYGYGVTMAEARTQCFVWQYLQDTNNPAVRAPRVYLAFTRKTFGFIVSEYIDGHMCDYADIARIIPAVQALISIPSPSSKPGPVGGGLIEHPFFIDSIAPIEYESVKDLQDHINGILRATERNGHVRFTHEVAKYGLRLCVSDLRIGNFMKDQGSRIVAVDFRGCSFLHPCFFAFAMTYGRLGHLLQPTLDYPPTPELLLWTLKNASGVLVPWGTNIIGQQISPSYKNLAHRTAQAFREDYAPDFQAIKTRRPFPAKHDCAIPSRPHRRFSRTLHTFAVSLPIYLGIYRGRTEQESDIGIVSHSHWEESVVEHPAK